MNFKIAKDQIARLKTFANYVRKLEAVCPLDNTQLFVVKDNKLNIYGYGSGALGSGNIEAAFDIESEDNGMFYANTGTFISMLEKTKSDKISCSLDGSARLSFKGDKSKSVFSLVVLSATDRDAADEYINAVTKYREEGNYYKASFTVDMTKKSDGISASDIFSRVASMSGALQTNEFVKLTPSGFSAVDNLSIIEIPIANVISEDYMYLHRGVADLVKETENFKAYNAGKDKFWLYIDIVSQGIKMYFAQPDSSFEIPTVDEIEAITPANPYKLVIDTNEFFNSIEEFEGMFDSASWRFKQVDFRFSANEKEVAMHYDNMVSTVDTSLAFEVDGEIEEDFEVRIPLIHMKYIEPELHKSDKLTVEISNESRETDKTPVIIKFLNSAITAQITKMGD